VQEAEYKKQGEELLVAAWRTLNLPDWRLERKLDNGDMVQVSAGHREGDIISNLEKNVVRLS
jgi:hypothetical protein